MTGYYQLVASKHGIKNNSTERLAHLNYALGCLQLTS